MELHPYLKYALALVMTDYNLSTTEDITIDMLKREIQHGLNHFSLKPTEDFVGKSDVAFEYSSEKNDAKTYHFLAPNAITSAMNASNLYKAAEKAINSQIKKLDSSVKLTQSEMPLAGEFNAFSISNNVGRGKPSSTVMNELLSLIVTLTPDKPCLNTKGNNGNGDNVCLIPDLTIEEDIDFIKLFKRMMSQRMSSDSLKGRIKIEEKKDKHIYIPKRPVIYFGNYPNAPRSSTLSGIALLSSIGELTKNAEVSILANRVLDYLKNSNIYTIGYGKASTYQFNHYIIDLSKEGRLSTIVDAIYWCVLYSVGPRNYKDKKNISEYQNFDLFTSRFLQLFNSPAFRDFVSFRAEYPIQIQLLLITFFEKMEKIDLGTVNSALEMGKWLNRAAYIAACNDAESKGEANNKEKIRQLKSKVLVELESSIMSAKTGDALLAQVIVRVGRLTGVDAPEKASLFMVKTASGELKLEQAKNMLMAFSRLRSGKTSDDKNIENNAVQEEQIEDNSEL